MKRKVVSAETKNKGPENPFSTAIRYRIGVALRDGKSLRGIAREAGISHPSLVQFLSGKRTLLLSAADRLAPVLDISCQHPIEVWLEERKDLTVYRDFGKVNYPAGPWHVPSGLPGTRKPRRAIKPAQTPR